MRTVKSPALMAALALANGANAYTWDSTIHSLVAPTGPPTATSEDWPCVTSDAVQYFKAPMATGDLLSALDSYGKSAMAPCMSTVQDFFGCMPSKDEWCDFAKAAPTGRRLGLWEPKSSAAASMAKECPNRWFYASLEDPIGPTLLNETIMFAACHAEAQGQQLLLPGGAVASTTPAEQQATATPAASGGGASPASGAAGPTPTHNSGQGRVAVRGNWMIAGAGLAVVVISATL
ncbi:hypothetical protein PG984_003107 [Apiospora sp. TS-2023a]